MASVSYPASTNDVGSSATIVVRGQITTVTDANIAAVVGSGNSAHFTAPFDIVVGRGAAAAQLHFRSGQTYVLSPEVKAALVAASAPMTVI